MAIACASALRPACHNLGQTYLGGLAVAADLICGMPCEVELDVALGCPDWEHCLILCLPHPKTVKNNYMKPIAPGIIAGFQDLLTALAIEATCSVADKFEHGSVSLGTLRVAKTNLTDCHHVSSNVRDHLT
jgi:hypothetical protein